MKKLRVFALLLLSLFLFSGCNLIDPENPEIPGELIDTPTGVSITNGVVSWNAVTDATEYRVIVGTTSYTTTETSYDLKTITGLAVGNHQVSVIAVGDGTVSLPSQTLTYTVQITAGLGTPVNLAINQDVLSWNAVDEATYYVVSIGRVKYQKTTTTMDLSTVTIPKGSYQITVTAYNETKSSLPSTALELTLNEDQFSSIYPTMLSEINEDYEPGMTLDDFEDYRYEYTSYLRYEYRTKNMLLGAFNAGINEEQLIEIIDYMDENEFDESPIAMMAMIKDMKGFDLSTKQLSELVYNLALNETYIESFTLQSELVMFVEQLEALEENLEESVLIPNYIYWNNMFQTYLTAEEYQVIQSFLEGNIEFYSPGANLHSIFYYDVLYLYELYLEKNPWEEDDEQEIHRLLYKVVIGMYEDEILIPRYPYEDGYKSLYVFNDIRSINLSKNETQKNILKYQERYADLLSDHQAYINQKTVHVDAINTVIDYVWLLEETIPNTWLLSVGNALNDESFTLEELAILKDEIIDVLLTSMPSEEDFQSINKALYQIILAQTNELNSDETLVVAKLASAQHQAIEMLLTFIGWIDVDQMTMLQENVPQLVNGLQSMESFEDLLAQLDTMIEVMDLWDAFVLENEEVVTEMDDESMAVLIEFVYEINLRYQISNYDRDIPWQLEQIERAEYLLENLDLISNSALSMSEVYKNLYDYLFGNGRANYEDIIGLIEEVSANEEVDYESLSELKNHLHVLMIELEIDAEFFSNYFELYLATASYGYLDFTETNLEETAQYLGEFAYEFYLASIDMIDYLSIEDIEDIMIAGSLIYSEEEVTETRTVYEYICDDIDCGYRYIERDVTYTRTTIDKEAYKAYILLIARTINGFIETYPTYVNSIETLLLDETAADLYGFIISSQFSSNDHYETIKAKLDLDQLDHMMMVAEMFMASIEMLDEFANSDGEILDYIFLTMGNLSDDTEEVLNPQTYIESILPYVGILIDHVDESTVKPMIKMILFTMLINDFQYEDKIEFDQYSSMFDAWIDNGSLILLDAVELIDSFYAYLVENGDYTMFDTNQDQGNAMFEFLITNMSAFLTTEKLVEVKAIANQVIDNLLSLSKSMEVLDIDQTELDELKVDIIDLIDFYHELMNELNTRYASDQFEDFYYTEYARQHFFDIESFDNINIYMIEEVILDEEIIIDFQTGDHVIIPFETTTEGYYKINVSASIDNEIAIYKGNKTNVMSIYGLPTVNLEGNQMYYIVYHNYSKVGEFTFSIEEVDVTGYFIDNPMIITEDGQYPFVGIHGFDYVYYKLEATTSGRYVLMIEENDYLGYHEVYITIINAEGISNKFYGYINYHNGYYIELDVVSGETCLFRIDTEGDSFESNIYWNEVFTNTEANPVQLELDVMLDLNDYQPFYTIWLAFDLENKNYYTLDFDGNGYIDFTIYDEHMNYYDSYWYVDTDGEPLNFDLPAKGYLEVNANYYFDISGVSLTKSENYIEYIDIALGQEQSYNSEEETYEYYSNYTFDAPADGNYMIITRTDGWGYVDVFHDGTDDFSFDFSHQYDELMIVTLEEGDEINIRVSTYYFTYLNFIIESIETKGETVENAVNLTSNEFSFYYLGENHTRAYYKFTPTITGEYLFLVQYVSGQVNLYQTDATGSDRFYISVYYNTDQDYYYYNKMLDANVTYYFYMDSQYPLARYAFGIADPNYLGTN